MQKNQSKNKFNRNKEIKPEISINKTFLINILNNNITERTKVNGYLQALSKNIKILKELIKEVK